MTHRFNGDVPEYDDFIKNCKKEIEEQENEYPDTSDKIMDRIREFASSEKPKWYITNGKEKKEINTGWSCPNFKDWYEKNKKHPADDKYWNEAMIIPFKNSVEIRSGNLPKYLKTFKTNISTLNLKIWKKRSFTLM